MAKTANKKSQQRWRENIEALTVAIVVALLFKYFILEISKIPSGSMQPTLMGHPQSGVFDRVLVDKLSFRFRDPERFEIVVFKHPLERSRVIGHLLVQPGQRRRRLVSPGLHPKPGSAVPLELGDELCHLHDGEVAKKIDNLLAGNFSHLG